MTARSKKNILGDSTNTYNNYPTFVESSKLAKSISLKNKGYEYLKGGLTLVGSGDSSSTADDSLSVSSNNTYDFTIDNHEFYSNCSYENSPLEDNSTILNSALGQKKKTVTDDTKYKTELCKNYTETGKCNYSKKCKFAHGKQELNEKCLLNKSRYKSKKCNSFFSTSYCPYGARCLFAHEQRTTEEFKSDFYYQKYLLFPELRENVYTENKRTLPIFKALKKLNEPCINGSEVDDDFIDFEQDRKLWEAFENTENGIISTSISSNINFNSFSSISSTYHTSILRPTSITSFDGLSQSSIKKLFQKLNYSNF